MHFKHLYSACMHITLHTLTSYKVQTLKRKVVVQMVLFKYFNRLYKGGIRILAGFIIWAVKRIHVSVVVPWARIWRHRILLVLVQVVRGRIKTKPSSLLLYTVVIIKASKLGVRLCIQNF